jgi:cytochrome c biogenesis protein CcdA
MSTTLLLTVTGLALLDSLNPATILGVALILVLPSGHPVRAALAYVLGAYVTVLGLGAGLYLAAGAAAGVLDGGLIWVRRIAFGLAALMLLRSALQRLRQTHRTQITLPAWFTPWTALPLGAVVTAADLPNAFPYAIAIERLVSSGITTPQGLLVLAGYALIYCLPCLLLFVAGLAWGDHIRSRLTGLYNRFGQAREVPPSIPAALGLGALALAAAGVALAN